VLPGPFERGRVVKKSDMTYILGIVFAAATSVAYCCVRWFKIEMLRYYPLEHVWKWGRQGGPSQAWYCMQTFAFLCGAAVALAVCGLLGALMLAFFVPETLEKSSPKSAPV